MSDWYIHKDTRGVIPRASFAKRPDRTDWLPCDEHGRAPTAAAVAPPSVVQAAPVAAPVLAATGSTLDSSWYIHKTTRGVIPKASLLKRNDRNDWLPCNEHGQTKMPAASGSASTPKVPTLPACEWYVGPDSSIVPEAAVANFLARGAAASDFVPYHENIPASEPKKALPIHADDYPKRVLVAIATALGVDNSGSKAELAHAINALNDEEATAAAIAQETK